MAKRGQKRILAGEFSLAGLVQGLLAATLVYIGYRLVADANERLVREGVARGFKFLADPAGFAIIQTPLAYSEQSSYGRAFLVGLVNTLLVAGLALPMALIGGGLLAAARLSGHWLASFLAQSYVNTLRHLPLLLQIFFWYFGVLRSLPPPRTAWAWQGLVFLSNRGLCMPLLQAAPYLELSLCGLAAWALWHFHRKNWDGARPLVCRLIMGALGLSCLFCLARVGMAENWSVVRPELNGFNFTGGLTLIPELLALLMALSLYTSAFIAEVIRGGMLAVDPGVKEASRALGLSPLATFRHVSLPLALRSILPPLTNQIANLLKNSSLATAIGYPDLVAVFAGTSLAQTGQAFEIVGLTMAVYLSLCLGVSGCMSLLGRAKGAQP